ncbi:MAG: prolyl oligopeptidase family serine peptidase [Rhodobiaceae bacterium]|nr:prolyl oligopeptidase family serine peptidase [Rhodobiaceae bacterium]
MPDLDRDTLWRLLGWPDGPPRFGNARVTDSQESGSIVIETMAVETPSGPVPATLCRPAAHAVPLPGILYCHAHGGRYDIGRRELLHGRDALIDPPYGPLLAARGFVVLCLDMAGFGDRQAEGTESALSKAALWNGQPLFGLMLADLSAGLDALAARPDVDPDRIAAFGISMGATHAYWLAALDDRVAAVAHLCAFSDIAGLIAAGGHDRHGHYMTVPGLLRQGDMGDVAALIAPRPHLVASGALDALTPPEALEPALARLRAAYCAAGARDRLLVFTSPDTGHAETPAMRAAVLAFLDTFANGDGVD